MRPVCDLILAARRALRISLKAEMLDVPLVDRDERLVRYLHFTMSREKREVVRIVFLDTANRVICEEIVATGSISDATIYPREILRRAMELGATGLIVAHNHPSGDPKPSHSDVQITRRLSNAGHELQIRVLDHLIVARSGWTSLRAMGLLL